MQRVYGNGTFVTNPLLAGSGKAMSLDDVVSTPSGFIKVKDLKVGDVIHSPDGGVQTITQLHPICTKDLYRMTFKDRGYVDTNLEHLWKVWEAGKSKNIDGELVSGIKTASVVSTQDIINMLENVKEEKSSGKRVHNPIIPVCSELHYNNNDTLPIEPYLLGLLLGDGWIKKEKYINRAVTVALKGDYITSKLSKLDLDGTGSADKFIPDIYKYSSVEERLSLLQGLMDTDGTVCKNGDDVEYCTVSKQLADDFVQVLSSLGGIGAITEKEPFYYNKDGEKIHCRTSYNVYIKIPKASRLFRLTGKKERALRGDKDLISRNIQSVEKLASDVPMRCISVSNEDGLYVQGWSFAVTHNSRLLLNKAGFYAHDDKDFGGVIFRRTSPPLKASGGLFTEAKKLYRPLGVHSKEQAMDIDFNEGGNLKFTHLEHEKDAEGIHQGLQYSFIGFDEL